MVSARATTTRQRLREFALGLPGAHEDFPWGERVIKVGRKVFLFLGSDESSDPGVGTKLVASQPLAVAQPGVKAMGYGLGRPGWVWGSTAGRPMSS